MTQEQQPSVMVDDGSGNPVDRKNLRTAAWGGLIGTALEQYDFVIYGTATAIVFTRIFFPNTEPGVGIIAGFATYAVGFLARPLGGLFFSRYGDRLGRKFVLVATLFLMGISTFLIGALPSFDQGSGRARSRRAASCCSPRLPRGSSAADTPRWCSWGRRRAPRSARWCGSWCSCCPTSRCWAGVGGWCSSRARW
jgi:MFS family permease